MKPWYSGVYSMAESSAEEGAIFAQDFGASGQSEEWLQLLADDAKGELGLFFSSGRRDSLPIRDSLESWAKVVQLEGV